MGNEKEKTMKDQSFFQTFLRMGDEQVNRLGLSPQLHQQMRQGEAANNYSPQTTRDALDPNMSDETFFERFMGVKKFEPAMTSFDFGDYDQQSYDDWHKSNGITPTLDRGHQFSRIPNGPNVGLQLKRMDGKTPYKTSFLSVLYDEDAGYKFYRRTDPMHGKTKFNNRIYSLSPDELQSHPAASFLAEMPRDEVDSIKFSFMDKPKVRQRFADIEARVPSFNFDDESLNTVRKFNEMYIEPSSIQSDLIELEYYGGIPTDLAQPPIWIQELREGQWALTHDNPRDAIYRYRAASDTLRRHLEETPRNPNNPLYADQTRIYLDRFSDTLYERSLQIERELLGIPEERQQQQDTEYTIQSGDNLTSIARLYNMTIEDLVTANDIENANMIRVGQVLRIPALENQPVPEPEIASDTFIDPTVDYLIRMEGRHERPTIATPGETRYTIGHGHVIIPDDPEKVRAWNAAVPNKDYTQFSLGRGTLTEEEARALFIEDLHVYINRATDFFPGFENFSDDLKVQMVSSTYRGSMGQSPRTRELINQGDFAGAADEFLDNNEYRNAVARGRPGIRPRMEEVSRVLRAEGER